MSVAVIRPRYTRAPSRATAIGLCQSSNPRDAMGARARSGFGDTAV
jgi:hypothetical protein